MVKRLLAATDLSERSDRALQRAVAIAGQHSAELEILTVVEDALAAPLLESQIELATRALELQTLALPRPSNASVSTRVVSGQDFIDILRCADEFIAELIVLGPSRYEMRSLFRGTTAERVIRFGHLPTLVVRAPVMQPYQRVMVAVDRSTHSQRALECALTLAPDADFLLVHALHVPFKGFLGTETIQQITREGEDRIRSDIDTDVGAAVQKTRVSPKWTLQIATGLPNEVLKAAAAQFDADLIAVGTHGRSAIGYAVLGSVAENLLADSSTDVLAARVW
jgi:nucleotide-binding universal stress UspA family protein